ncbi:hypothetical protein MesoLj113b_68880 (plasmid) [Mesorhizobium sp. 113-3-3]|nr:hypothetical protein MesoLj113b_68880 [Mesorhizobium sp. 113-3-3]
MNKGDDHLHCVLHILRLRDGRNKGDCVGDMIVTRVRLTAGQEIRSLGPSVGGEPLQSWLGRPQSLRKPLENAWERVDEGVLSA